MYLVVNQNTCQPVTSVTARDASDSAVATLIDRTKTGSEPTCDSEKEGP